MYIYIDPVFILCLIYSHVHTSASSPTFVLQEEQMQWPSLA